MLSGVIGSFPGRIATVICTDDNQVVIVHFLEQLGQATVKILERFRISGRITAVPIEHVEIDEVGKHDRSVRRGLERLERGIEQSRITRCLDFLCYTFVSVDVRNLADADDFAPTLDELVQHGRCGRRCRQVFAVSGANEVIFVRANEGPCDDPADVIIVNEFASNVTELIKPVQAE